MIKLKESQIKSETIVCPYCMNDWTERKDMFGCCGEVGHQENAFITTDDECLLESEVIIENKLESGWPVEMSETKRLTDLGAADQTDFKF